MASLHRKTATAAAVALAAAAAVDGPKVKWQLAAYGQPRSVTLAADKLGEFVAAQTNGNFKIEVVYGATLAPEKEIIDGLKIGAYEAGWVVPVFAPGKQPILGLLGLPFLPLEDMKVAIAVGDAFHRHPAVKRDFDVWSAVYGLSLVTAAYEFMGTGKAPEKLSDWKGLRVRAIGGQGTAMAKLGAVPTTVTGPEIYGAMEKGVIDASGLAYYAFSTYKLQEISKWYTKGMALGVSITNVAFNKDAHEKLPPQYKKLIADSVMPAMKVQAAAIDGEESKAEEAFKQKGLKLVTIPPAMRDDFMRVAGQPVWDEFVKDMTAKGYPAKDLLDFVLAEAKKGAS